MPPPLLIGLQECMEPSFRHMFVSNVSIPSGFDHFTCAHVCAQKVYQKELPNVGYKCTWNTLVQKIERFFIPR